ncbi:hypothetical protein ABZ540_07445 [Nocardia xishanensis]|uniref:hypothetical protein n=1 Tax=Nocardia xishanensis TaxID=238964 RepID=UPI0033E5320B
MTDGAEGTFDQALTNGLAAIVAHTWPGEEMKTVKGKRVVRSASELLKQVISERTNGTGRVPHAPDAPVTGEGTVQGPSDSRPYTEVDIEGLGAAVAATQVIRHARDTGTDTDTVLTEEHLVALAALDSHPALGSLHWVQVDREWDRTEISDDAEIERAHRYYNALDEAEIERRVALDYSSEAFIAPDEPVHVEQCPVCGADALVAHGVDSMAAMVGVGHCWVCSYERSMRVADQMTVNALIERTMERDN